MQNYFSLFKILLNHPNKFRLIYSRFLMKTKLSRNIIFSRNGYKLRFSPSALTAALWLNPHERLMEEIFLAEFVKSGDFIVDVGANIGTISLALAKKIEGQGQIYAFEPHPRIYSYLENNIKLNKQNQCILTHCTALGEKAGTMFFSDKSDDTNNQLGTEGKLKVAIQMLDEVIPYKQPISLLKIDVEGFEYQVLQGASRVLEQTDFIYLECIPEMLSLNGGSEEMICDLLLKSGFSIYFVEKGKLKPNVIGSHKKKMICAKR